MASNYWLSSQCNHWLFTHAQLETARAEDLRYADSPDEVAAIGIWACNAIATLTKRLNLRQCVTATASVFLRRFYARTGNSFSSTDPALVASACVYVAAKVEETPVHVRSVVAEAHKFWTELGHPDFPNDVSALAEMEFFLFEELDFHLVVYHPYRALLALSGAVGKAARTSRSTAAATAATATDKDHALGLGLGLPALPEASYAATTLSSSGDLEADLEAARRLSSEELAAWEQDRLALTLGDDGQPIARLEELDDAALQYAWFVVNDTYRTDISLLYPPHLIAIAALWLGLVLHPPSRDKLESSAQSMAARRARWASAYEQQDLRTSTARPAASSVTPTALTPAASVQRTAGSQLASSVASPRVEAQPTSTSPAKPPSALPLRGLASLPMRPAHLPPRPGAAVTAIPSAASTPRPAFMGTASPESSSIISTSPEAAAAAAAAVGTAAEATSARPTPTPTLPPAPTPPPDALSFLAALNVDLRLVAEIVQQILALYKLWHRLDAAEPGKVGMMSDGPGMLKLIERMRERRRLELVLLASAPQ